jgi:hypothetical protein
MLLRPAAPGVRAPLASLEAYRAAELGRGGGTSAASTSAAGVSPYSATPAVPEYETLALRVAPPEVIIDNDAAPGVTTIRVSSANRAGTLVSVCSVLISLSLDIRKAHISSDGGWFLDGELNWYGGVVGWGGAAVARLFSGPHVCVRPEKNTRSRRLGGARRATSDATRSHLPPAHPLHAPHQSLK